MIRRLVGILVILIVLAVLAVFLASFFIGSIIKKGVETAGPTVTKVDVKLDGANLAFLSGNGALHGLVIGNPEGFKTPSALKVGIASIEVVPRSVFADKVIVRSIKVQSPEVTFEGSLQGNNLSKLLDNIKSATGSSQGGTTKPSESGGRRIEVDDLLVTGGKINLSMSLLGGTAVSLPLPDIHLTDLGKNSEGLTTAELSERIMKELVASATQAVTTHVSSLGKGLGDAAQAVGSGAGQQVEKVTKSIGNLFKKK